MLEKQISEIVRSTHESITDKKLKTLILGTQATKFVFDCSVSIWNDTLAIEAFMDDRVNFMIGEPTQKNSELLNKMDAVLFDLLGDIVSKKITHDNMKKVILDFVNRVHIQNPRTRIIYNSVRYASHVMNGEDESKKNIFDIIKPETRQFRNNLLNKIEKFIQLELPEVDLIKYHDITSAYEENVIKGYPDMYFNYDYWLDTLIQFQEYMGISSYTRVLNLEDAVILAESAHPSAMLVKGDGLLPLWKIKDNDGLKKLMTRLLQLDYIIDGKADGWIRFIQRTDFHRSNLIESNGIYYSTQKSRETSNGIQNIVFYFQPMTLKGYFGTDAGLRFNPSRFQSLNRSLVKDTLLVRISDVNLMEGSYFVNTVNYQEYEKNMVAFIHHIMNKYDVKKENTVLYGFSRGGLGALWYGEVLDLPTVAVDPVIDSSYFNGHNGGDHYVSGLRKINLLPELNNMERTYDNKKYIITNQYVKQETYQSIVQLKGRDIRIIDFNLPEMVEHGWVVHHIPEQLTLINSFLM